MAVAWRIVKARHAESAFDGEGARRHGGRWNSRGTAVVYVAGSISLAVLEIVVHLATPRALRNYVTISVEIDDDLIDRLDPERLPDPWRSHPPPPEVQRLGDRWVVEETSAVLAVPSVIVPRETNYLLNPAHPDFARLRIGPPEPLELDERLAGR